jgi:hypothetical protein
MAGRHHGYSHPGTYQVCTRMALPNTELEINTEELDDRPRPTEPIGREGEVRYVVDKWS